MEDMVSFWKGKKIFITGHTGFKGSWLSLWLQYLQADVMGYALAPPTSTNLFTKANIANGMVDERGDVCDYASLQAAIHSHQPDIIFHLAAQSLVRYSYSHPVETYQTNVMGTVNLLEVARHTPSVRAIVNVTTDKCYENKEIKQGYREEDQLGGYDPYSNSKGCSELITSAYRQSYFNEEGAKKGLASARAGNVIGGGDWAEDRLLPDLMKAGAEGSLLTLRYPDAIRPWQHVLESLSGYLLLAQHLHDEPKKNAEAWNFGPNEIDDKPVSWIANEVVKLWGEGLQWQKAEGVYSHEATYLKLNCFKAHTLLGWKPRWNIVKALTATVAWYKAYYAGVDARVLTISQIEDYMMRKNIPAQ